MLLPHSASKVAAGAVGLLLAVTAASSASASPSRDYTGPESCMLILQPDGAQTADAQAPFCVEGSEDDLLRTPREERNIIVAEATPEGRAEVSAEQRAATLSGDVAPTAPGIGPRLVSPRQ